jgi:hypothetical protein
MQYCKACNEEIRDRFCLTNNAGVLCDSCWRTLVHSYFPKRNGKEIIHIYAVAKEYGIEMPKYVIRSVEYWKAVVATEDTLLYLGDRD